MNSSSTPKIRRTFIGLVITLALILITNNAAAISRIGNATVTEKDGSPCFSVSSKERIAKKEIALLGVNVSDLFVIPVEHVWAFATSAENAVVIPVNQCIKYGYSPATSQSKPAGKLISGRVYEVVLKVHSKKQSTSTQGYLAKFCITSEPDEKFSIKQILPSMQDWKDNRCRKK
jgi:hypothetical protein